MATTIVQFPPGYFLRAPGRYFDIFGVAPAAAGSTNVELVRFVVPNNHVGILLGVSFEAGQLTGHFWGTFNLEIAGGFDQNLNGVQGMVARLAEPIPVWRVLKPNNLVRVLVSNGNGSSSFQYAGRLMGYVQEEQIPLTAPFSWRDQT